MSRWFRFYDDAVNDPKLIKLPDDTFRAWVNLLCLAAKGNGILPATDDVAISLRVKPARAAAVIAELVSAGLLDKVESSYSPHNWHGRQYKSDVSTERVKRFRNGQRNVSNKNETVSETPPDTEQIQKQKTDADPDGSHLVLVHPDLEAQFFRRAQEVLGNRGLGAKLLQAKNKNLALARAALETAATKDDPREYVGRIISGRGTDIEDLRARGEAW